MTVDQDEPSGSCPACWRRDPHTPQLCGVCRSRFRTWLVEIPDLHAQLLAEEPSGIAGQRAGGRVSGSKERPLPIRVDPLDLTGPARHVWLLGEDQVGYESVASVLDFWVRDWREARGGLERLPEPSVPVLAAWLLRRADDAMDAHPAVDECFEDVRRVHGALRAQLGLVDPRPEYLDGVPCKRCGAATLWRVPGSDYASECAIPTCKGLLTEDEYAAWTSEVATTVRRNGIRRSDKPAA
ncbi:hypothetical protein Drose_04295 [Dactylosporangium roseum]|uniref:Uncharacterized protein n=1 Tax=Dactylosporangium roseum TaxID=47989 RepID=A0ABY5Z628_9ACTN|nr:hypothetical protein [Dactylosporangium roseum]UWZ37510.1 hypothetical protein Drose_04295 [Dactylosporangium roseum]